MNAVGTLAWLEWRQFVNRLRESIRQPARLVVIALGILYIIFLLWVRTLPSSANVMRPAGFRIGIPEPFASMVGFAAILLVALTFQLTSAGFIRGFESAADARFTIGSAIPERTAVLWVQLRSCATTVLRAVWAILIYAVLFQRAGTSLGIVLSSVGIFVLSAALPIPLLKLDRATRLPLTQSLAVAFWCAGGIPLALLVVAYFFPMFSAASDPIVRFGAGTVINAMISASARPLLALYGVIASLFVLCYALGTDIYPELYAGSTRAIRLRDRQQRAAFVQNIERETRVQRDFRAPKFLMAFRGAWTLLWRDVTTFGRSTTLRIGFWAFLLAALIVGAGIGVFAARTSDVYGVSIAIASSLINVYVILVALGSTIALGEDLRKPLFWLCADPLRARLYAWAISTSWRAAIAFSLGILAWSLAAHIYVVAWIGIPTAATVVFLLRAIGLGMYALLPGKADQRGPLAMLRMLLTYALVVPAIVAGTVFGAISHQPVPAFFIALAVAVIESLILIEFAAWRIDGRGAAVAQSENV